MFEFLSQMSVSKFSALIIRCFFYLARCFGILCLGFKITSDGQDAIKESGPRWIWFFVIIRVACLCYSNVVYINWICTINVNFQFSLHIIRLFLSILCFLSILRLQIFCGRECTQLVNRFLQLNERVGRLCERKQKGFGGTHELVLLMLMLACLSYEVVLMMRNFLMRQWIELHYWIPDSYNFIGNKLIMHIAFVGYLALGLLYSDLNDYVRSEFGTQMESLEEQPSRQKLRNVRKKLDKCLALYEDIQALASVFQRIYDLPLLFCLGRNVSEITMLSYSCFITDNISLPWLLVKCISEILTMLLLTLAVQRAIMQFGAIHRLTLENCYLCENKEWHTALEVFYTHLNLYEFRVRPLGLFNITNEMMVVFLSALVTYLTVVIQYAMQL